MENLTPDLDTRIQYPLIKLYGDPSVFKNTHFLVKNTQIRNFENPKTGSDSL